MNIRVGRSNDWTPPWTRDFVAICCASALFATLGKGLLSLLAVLARSSLHMGGVLAAICFRAVCYLGEGILSPCVVLPLSLLA